MTTHKWTKWAVLEGLTKTTSRTFQKVVGGASNNWGGTFLAAGIIGFVQVLYAAIVITRQGGKFFKDPVGIFGCVMFGLLALISTVFGFATFLYGGDISISTFIVTLSIVPGMIIDVVFFKYKSTPKEWVGMAIAIIAGWAVLDFPSVSGLLTLPIWVLFACGTMMSTAINQGITQKVKKVDAMFKNFWGGMVALVGAPLILLFRGEFNLILTPGSNPTLWKASAFIGLVVICMWSFNLLSYKTGASIALKKLVMNGTYLLTTMMLGYIIFGEHITGGKLTSIPLFVLAYVLMDKKAWDYVTGSSTDGSPGNAAKPA